MGNGASSLSLSSPSTKQPIIFIDFDQFKTHGSIPRNPLCEQMCTTLEAIDRENSVVVFVSHVWLMCAGEADPSPDDRQHNKYKLMVNGITKLVTECAPTAKKCYLW